MKNADNRKYCEEQVMQIVTPLLSEVRIVDTGKKVIISDDKHKKIEEEWQQLVNHNPRMFNGPIYSVDMIDEHSGGIQLSCSHTNYAHYRYDEKNNSKDEICHNLYG